MKTYKVTHSFHCSASEVRRVMGHLSPSRFFRDDNIDRARAARAYRSPPPLPPALALMLHLYYEHPFVRKRRCAAREKLSKIFVGAAVRGGRRAIKAQFL